jgi:hypothetical protein
VLISPALAWLFISVAPFVWVMGELSHFHFRQETTEGIPTSTEINKSVANYNSQVWKFSNLYVGGNGVLPTPYGANPTLTSICMAMRSAYKIHTDLAAGELIPAFSKDILTPTPKEWLAWADDKHDPNYPNHARNLHRSV